MPETGSKAVYLAGDDWKAYFRDFERSAFRLEVHQTYTMPGEVATFRAFRSGEPMPKDFNCAWHRTIRDHAAVGRTMTRAKIVRRPLTPYSRYLFAWGIPGNVEAGEDYRILDVTAPPLGPWPACATSPSVASAWQGTAVSAPASTTTRATPPAL